jgi:hypothetical protein
MGPRRHQHLELHTVGLIPQHRNGIHHVSARRQMRDLRHHQVEQLLARQRPRSIAWLAGRLIRTLIRLAFWRIAL